MFHLLRAAVCLSAVLFLAASVEAREPCSPIVYHPLDPLNSDGPPVGSFVDFEAFLNDDPSQPVVRRAPPAVVEPRPFAWQILPTGIIYKAYLAGPKESRLAGKWVNRDGDGWQFDSTLGGRFGLVRHGTFDPFKPQGFQIDVEGSAQLRLDPSEDMDLQATDYRAGVPLTFGYGDHQTKLAYYHLSSHVGDEFLLKNSGFDRLNFARDVLVLGHAVYVLDNVRIYGEAAWAFYSDVSEEWEFQFGLDYAPMLPTGLRGAPFLGINAHLREEVNFGGTLTAQAGWAWRSDDNGSLLRMGLHYLNGESNHFSFYNDFEQQVGFGVWYDR